MALVAYENELVCGCIPKPNDVIYCVTHGVFRRTR